MDPDGLSGTDVHDPDVEVLEDDGATEARILLRAGRHIGGIAQPTCDVMRRRETWHDIVRVEKRRGQSSAGQRRHPVDVRKVHLQLPRLVSRVWWARLHKVVLL